MLHHSVGSPAMPGPNAVEDDVPIHGVLPGLHLRPQEPQLQVGPVGLVAPIAGLGVGGVGGQLEVPGRGPPGGGGKVAGPPPGSRAGEPQECSAVRVVRSAQRVSNSFQKLWAMVSAGWGRGGNVLDHCADTC